MAVLVILKQVWNIASTTLNFAGSDTPCSYPTMEHTISMKGCNTIIIQITPKTLKNMWANAARRACVEAVSAAKLDVTVVPMFSPITSAIP